MAPPSFLRTPTVQDYGSQKQHVIGVHLSTIPRCRLVFPSPLLSVDFVTSYQVTLPCLPSCLTISVLECSRTYIHDSPRIIGPLSMFHRRRPPSPPPRRGREAGSPTMAVATAGTDIDMFYCSLLQSSLACRTAVWPKPVQTGSSAVSCVCLIFNSEGFCTCSLISLSPLRHAEEREVVLACTRCRRGV